MSPTITTLWADRKEVTVTEQHREIARLLYDVRPYRIHNPHKRHGGRASAHFDEAPAWYQLELLELAHAAMRHPGFVPTAGPDELEVQRLGDEKPTIVRARPPEWPDQVSER